MKEAVRTLVEGKRVLCALSGGMDSVVLLHLLLASGAEVSAAHVEHGIRGQASLDDCAFVERLCAQWQVPLYVAHVDVPAQAKATGCGIEETARQMRYDFLRRTRRQNGFDRIAVAHHSLDQAETLIEHLVRGCGPNGLGGMAVDDGELLRPLLSFPKEAIERYARENQLPFVVDETNADVAYTRNYIRAQVIPDLQRINPRAVEALNRLSDAAREQNDFIACCVRQVLEKRQSDEFLGELADLHPALQNAVLLEYIRRQGFAQVTRQDVERLRGLFKMQTGKRVNLGKEFFERNTNGIRRVIMKQTADCVPLREGKNETPFGVISLAVGAVPEQKNLGRFAQAFDADAMPETLYVRPWRPGDRIALYSGGSKKLSDLFSERKIPRALRGSIPILTDGSVIYWAAGIAPGAEGRLNAQSRRALILNYTASKE